MQVWVSEEEQADEPLRRQRMTQKMPRNQALHERRHHRKAGAHGDDRKGRRESANELRRAIEDYLLQTPCDCEYRGHDSERCAAYQASRRVKQALTWAEEE